MLLLIKATCLWPHLLHCLRPLSTRPPLRQLPRLPWRQLLKRTITPPPLLLLLPNPQRSIGKYINKLINKYNNLLSYLKLLNYYLKISYTGSCCEEFPQLQIRGDHIRATERVLSRPAADSHVHSPRIRQQQQQQQQRKRSTAATTATSGRECSHSSDASHSPTAVDASVESQSTTTGARNHALLDHDRHSAVHSRRAAGSLVHAQSVLESSTSSFVTRRQQQQFKLELHKRGSHDN